MLLSDFIRENTAAMSELYPEPEARNMVLVLCQDRLGVMSYTHVIEPITEIPPEELPGLQEDMSRLLSSEPLQYILGYSEFCGRNFNVDGRALIPRAETELLAQTAEGLVSEMTDYKKLNVLDLCTGCGCIAWTLALDLPGARVVATDLSEDALALAESQPLSVRRPAAAPVFVKADVLDVEATVAAFRAGNPGAECGLLTANPPYVMVSEKAEMRANVLDYEPDMALFAPEGDPLAFHRAIAQIAMRVLAPGGQGVVEINSELPDETAAVFSSAGLSEVEVVADFFDRPRYITFIKA